MEMSVHELASQLATNPNLYLLDVRGADEYTHDGYVAGSVLIPLPELALRLAEIPKDRPIACFCRSGQRSKMACDVLRQHGYTELTNVTGGILSWRAANLPTEF